MKAILVGLIILTFVGGCASGPQFRPADSAPNDKATVYIYRPKQIIGWDGLIPVNSPHVVYLNGTNSVVLHEGGYCVYYVKSGTNFFSSQLLSIDWMLNAAFKKDDLFQKNFEAQQTYYIKFEVGAISPKVKLMDARTGEQQIQGRKLEAPSN